MELRVTALVRLLLVVFLSACGGGGGNDGGGPPTPPTISNLTYSPAAVPVTSAGSTMINGTLDFIDSGGDLSSLTVTVTDAAGNQVATATAPIQGVSGHTSGTIAGSFQVASTTVGLYTIHISVADSGGSRSNELAGLFQVVAVSNQSPVITATALAPASLTAANGDLYWSEPGTAALRRVVASGGSTVDLATRVVNVQAFAYTGSDVIWEDDRPSSFGACGSTSTTRVLSRTTAGGVTTVLASGSNCAFFTGSDIVVDGNTLFWISSTNSPDTYVINATPIAGGITTAIATSNVPIVALGGGSGTLFWMENVFSDTIGAIREIASNGGAVTTLASGFGSAAAVFAIDNNNVYYTTPNFPWAPPFMSSLVAQPLAGGAPVTVSNSISTPSRLVAANGQILWIDGAGVNSIPAGGGAVATLATTTSFPVDLLVSGGNAVWSESTGAAHGESGAIRSVPLAGGSINTIYQGGDAPRRLLLDASSHINWTEGGPIGQIEGFSRIARLTPTNIVQTVLSGISSAAPAFVVTPTDLFIADLYRIKRLPITGGMPETVAADDGAIAALAVDNASVYWDSAQQGSVRTAPIGGGSVTNLAVAGALVGYGGPIHLAPNGNLYWVVGGSALLSVPAVGGTPTVVAQGLPNIVNLVIDSANAYFADATTGNILKLALAGGAPVTLSSVGYFPTAPLPLVLDGTTLYWLDSNRIAKIPTTGGALIEVLDFTSGSEASATLAVNGTSVFWTEPSALDIRASPK